MFFKVVAVLTGAFFVSSGEAAELAPNAPPKSGPPLTGLGKKGNGSCVVPRAPLAPEKTPAKPIQRAIRKPVEAQVQTWREALASAYGFNPDLRLSLSSLRETQESRKQALGEWAPQLSLVASQDASDSTRRGFIDKLSESTKGGVQLSQSLFSGGGTMARLHGADKSIQAADLQLTASENQILLEALSIFLQLCTAQEALKFFKQDEADSLKVYEQTKARYEVGEATYTDVLTQEARVAASRSRRESGEGAVKTARARFESVIGKSAAEKLIWPDDLKFQLPTNLDLAIEKALRENPSVCAAASHEDAVRCDVNSRIASSMLPRVDATASAFQRATKDRTSVANVRGPGTNDSGHDLSVGVQMTVPIPTGVPQSQVRTAEQKLAQARLNRQKTQLSVQEAVVKAWTDLDVAIKNLEQTTIETKANRQAFEGAQEEYNLGLKTLIDVAVIQGSLLKSEVGLLESKQNVILAKAKLMNLLGGLLAKDLKLDVVPHNREASDAWLGIGIREE